MIVPCIFKVYILNITLAYGTPDDTYYYFRNNKRDTIMANTESQGIKDILSFNPEQCLDLLSQEGKNIIDSCIDFLLFNQDYPRFLKKNQHDFHKEKYISIWSFIRDFLKIEDKYDYYLMNFLEWYDLMDHGGGIRNGWINSDRKYYQDRILSEKRKQEITEWGTNAPDNWTWL